MKQFPLFSLVCLTIAFTTANAQTTLPGFTVKELTKGKIQISWLNPYPSCVQLAVQRSFDSAANFRTIFSSQSPELPSNGFVDNQAPPGLKMYYRIFFVLKGGTYFFSKAQRIGEDEVNNRVVAALPVVPKSVVRIFKKGTLAFIYNYPDYLRFRDSIITKTMDSLYTIVADSIDWRPSAFAPFWKPSSYVFTNEKGYVSIHLPDVKQHHYRILFFEESGPEIFQIKTIRDPDLILDKASFIHAGWFNFELYEDEKLKEKNKFFLQKD